MLQNFQITKSNARTMQFWMKYSFYSGHLAKHPNPSFLERVGSTSI